MHAAVLYTYLMPAQRHPLLSFLWEQEQLPYEASALRQRLAGNDTAELQDMHEALSQRARELTAELIALAAPESAYPGTAWSLDARQ